MKYKVEHTEGRLDRWLADKLQIPVRRAKLLIDERAVFHNGKLGKAGVGVVAGDEVEILGDQGPVSAKGEQFTASPLRVLYEDAQIVAVEKPRKMHSVRLRHDDAPTVADFLAGYSIGCLSASPDPREAGLIQRLDYYTSGVLLAGKDPASWQQLKELMKRDKITKEYLALVEGAVASQVVDAPLLQIEGGKRMSVSFQGEPARTEIYCERKGTSNSIVRCVANGARRHQIRVHLASIGHPLVGDVQYGAATGTEEDGFYLHASTVAFPWHGKELKVQASEPNFPYSEN